MSMLGKPQNKTESIELVKARQCIYITLAVLSCLLNGVFLAALWKSWKLVKQRRISYHIANLACSDALVGASTLFHYIAGESKASNVFMIGAWATVLSSLLAISVMAFERALAIKLPLRWREIFPLKKLILVMLSNWCVTLVLAILMYYHDLIMRFIMLIIFMVTIMITSLMYFYIYIRLEKKRDVVSVPAKVRDINRGSKQRKISSFVLLLTAILVLTASPSFLTQIVKNSCIMFELECDFTDTLTQLTDYFYMLEIANFVVNPVIYVWRMKLYRRAIRRLFGKTDPAVYEASSGAFTLNKSPKDDYTLDSSNININVVG